MDTDSDFEFSLPTIEYSDVHIDLDKVNNKGKMDLVFHINQDDDYKAHTMFKYSVKLVEKFYANIPNVDFQHVEDKDGITHRLILRGDLPSVIEVAASFLLTQVDIGDITLKELLGMNGLQRLLLNHYAEDMVQNMTKVEGDKDGDYSYR